MTNKNLFQLLLGFFTVVLLVSSCTSEDGPNTEADTAAINAIWSTYVSSLEAGDIDAWLSLWTEDGVQMPPNEAPVIGFEPLRMTNCDRRFRTISQASSRRSGSNPMVPALSDSVEPQRQLFGRLQSLHLFHPR